MKRMKFLLLVFCGLLFIQCAAKETKKQHTKNKLQAESPRGIDTVLEVGASRSALYLPLLKDKRVALVVNQTSQVGQTHLVDFLLAKQVNIIRLFAPEHGFRGKASAGEYIKNGKDSKTGLPIVSLYGKNKKPTPKQLEDIDVVVFDIQDVGTRFYTYISTMHYMMEACAEANKLLVILDRPNPNGHYIDGTILEKKHTSFVGMHPIPIVHGLTVGELAHMINGEKWLKNKVSCDIKVIPCKNYTHKTPYSLPIPPSPNLPNDRAIELYPTLCLFEGTPISVGRGTNFPFQLIGHPNGDKKQFSFVPKPNEGAKYPLHENKTCYGDDLRHTDQRTHAFSLHYLITYYNQSTDKQNFFTNFFVKLAGTEKLANQIKQGLDEAEIRATWQADLNAYKRIRKNYLLYDD